MAKKQNPLEILGARLKEVRVKREMSQTDVAKLLDVAKQTISNWELGKAPPMITNLIRFASIMQIDISQLLAELSDDLGPEDHLVRRVAALGELIPLFSSEEEAANIIMESLTYSQKRDRAQRFVAPASAHNPETDIAFVVVSKANLPRFRPGDRVTIKPEVQPEPGQFVLAVADKQVIFRRYLPKRAGTHEGAELRAIDERYPTIHMTKRDVILGVMGEHTSTSHE